MAVTAFDGSFSFKQDSLARLGERSRPGAMSAGQRAAFNESPFMQGVRRTEEMCFEFTLSRDQKRAQTDPSFKPQDSDWSAPKAFEYKKNISYYKTLGIDEYAPLDEVKKAYKKLSLVYHPDKTTHLDEKDKEEYAGIFIELKNAYLTLGDQATRRQYDRDRDREKANNQINGYKPKKEAQQFDAAKVLEHLQKNQKAPGKTVNLPVKIKLEKFFYGGHKAVRRSKKVKELEGFTTKNALHRIDVKPGASEPFECLFRGAGDHNEKTKPDSLAFQVRSKPHKIVKRVENDLELNNQVPLPSKEELSEPYMWLETPSVNGRYILLWGRNPFYMSEQEGSMQLNVKIQGEGLTANNYLKFKCTKGGTGASAAAASAGGGVKPPAAKADSEMITLRNMQTEAKLHMWARPEGTLMEVRHRASEILGIPRNSGMRILRKLQDGRGFVPYSEQQVLGTLRELNVAGVNFEKVEMPPAKALSFLRAVSKELLSDAFKFEMTKINTLAAESMERAGARLALAWEGLYWILPDYGYEAKADVMQDRIRFALGQAPKAGREGKAEAEDIGTLIMKCSVPQPDKASAGTSAPKSGGSSSAASPSKQAASAVPREGRLPFFLERHGLGPPGGFDDDIDEEDEDMAPRTSVKHGQGGLCDNKKIAKREERTKQKARICDLEFTPLGEPVVLFTKPTCKLHFYSNTRQSPYAPPGQIKPRAMFAVTVSSQSCMANKARRHFETLKEQLIPMLKLSIFNLLQASRSILPKVLSDFAFFKKGEYEGITINEKGPPVPWKKLGDASFKKGDNYTGIIAYTRCLEEIPDDDSAESLEAAATAFSNRSACLAKVGHFQEALADAKKAIEKRPKWGRAWSRAGLAASYMGPAFQKEAFNCYMQAVEYDASANNVEYLSKIALQGRQPSADASHPEKELGNEALRVKEFGKAVAHYTVGLSLVPPEELETREGEVVPKVDGHELLRAVLHSNRAGAYCQLKNWQAAVDDGRKAVKAKDDFVKGRIRLGTALIGAGYPEQAYPEFARALVMEPSNNAALKGREACMGVIPLWRSVPAKKRHKDRFAFDLTRPASNTRVYAISDVFFDHKENEDWAHSIDDFKFSEDVLIVAGNMCDTRVALGRALVTLKAKFRRVFYIPGNHEMAVVGEGRKYSDSIGKLFSIYELCDELGVDIFPAAVAQGVFVVPLLSWYNGEFDTADPSPNMDDSIDLATRWPIDKETQVWKYFLKMNVEHLRHLYHGTVITFSHFIPRPSLRFEKRAKGGAKVVGCEGIDGQARIVNTKIHVYGHTAVHGWSRESNVIYANHYHGTEDDHIANPPLLCIFDGKNIKRQEVTIQ